jgi:hypothetical protein
MRRVCLVQDGPEETYAEEDVRMLMRAETEQHTRSHDASRPARQVSNVVSNSLICNSCSSELR